MGIHLITIEPSAFGDFIYFSLATTAGFRLSKYYIHDDKFEVNKYNIDESNEINHLLRKQYNLN